MELALLNIVKCDLGIELIILLYPPALEYAMPQAIGNAMKNIKNWKTSVSATARTPPKSE
ncbi:hypothetical protein h2es_1007 [Rickettsiales endosymbiont of Trichoplax sp. H2]|nr:hypothetical protein [Rickettsiales endosymbiont of Trichoplax sp. H2]